MILFGGPPKPAIVVCSAQPAPPIQIAARSSCYAFATPSLCTTTSATRPQASSSTASDRRTAIEIQIIRSSLDAQGGQVRWVDHTGMYADAMAKRGGNIPLFQTLMRTGRIAITKESIALEQERRGSSSKTYSDPAATANGSAPAGNAQATLKRH